MAKTNHIVKVSASLLAAMMIVAAMLFVAPLEAEAEDPIDYIYFDLAAGSVTINASTFTGYVYVNGINTKVTGTHSSGNHYYVYQSTAANRSTTGYLNTSGKVEGTPVLPVYERVTYKGESWGEFITNHPGDTGVSTNIEADNSGATSVEQVIDAWEAAVGTSREATSNQVVFSGNVGNVELVIDNVWSDYLEESRSSRDSGSIAYCLSGEIKNNTVTLKIKGDNRRANVFYAPGSGDGDTNYNRGNQFVFDVLEDDKATLTVATNANNLNGNRWSAAIGSADSKSPCEGLVFQNGIIYAGTTNYDDATAIGGGGNGYAKITIKGGTVTAVASTSGSTIGGGIGKSDPGGSADVSIQGGTVYSYNFSFGIKQGEPSNGRDINGDINKVELQGYKYILSSAIGGGSSANSSGCKFANVTISGGTVYAQSVGGTAIGGGSSTNKDGGSTNVTINGGTITAKSVAGRLWDGAQQKFVDIPAGVAIGGGTGNEKGGAATLSVSGNAKLYTGSIGGGGFTATNGKGKIGPAFVTISGGTIQGQVVI